MFLAFTRRPSTWLRRKAYRLETEALCLYVRLRARLAESGARLRDWARVRSREPNGSGSAPSSAVAADPRLDGSAALSRQPSREPERSAAERIEYYSCILDVHISALFL